MSTTLERKARRVAERAGLRAVKSRRREGSDNYGGFMLVEPLINAVVAGSQYDLTPEDVIRYCAE